MMSQGASTRLHLARRPKHRPLTPAGRFWLGYVALLGIAAWVLA